MISSHTHNKATPNTQHRIQNNPSTRIPNCTVDKISNSLCCNNTTWKDNQLVNKFVLRSSFLQGKLLNWSLHLCMVTSFSGFCSGFCCLQYRRAWKFSSHDVQVTNKNSFQHKKLSYPIINPNFPILHIPYCEQWKAAWRIEKWGYKKVLLEQLHIQHTVYNSHPRFWWHVA